MSSPNPSDAPDSRSQLAIVLAALVLSALLIFGFAKLAPSGADEAVAGDTDEPARAQADRPPPQPDGPKQPNHPVPTLNYKPSKGPAYELIHLLGHSEVTLHDEPGGEAIETLGPRTEFGSGIVAPVVRRSSPDWIGVQTGLLGNGVLGWTRFDSRRMERLWTKYSLRVDTSDRRLQLRYGSKLIDEYTVTVGAVGSDTPSGRFAVTDAITFSDSPWYGCCALALSAHQSNLPVGWIGGDRVAIHGTTGGVGLAESHGCIRATNDTMLELFDRIPIGTPVFIRA